MIERAAGPRRPPGSHTGPGRCCRPATPPAPVPQRSSGTPAARSWSSSRPYSPGGSANSTAHPSAHAAVAQPDRPRSAGPGSGHPHGRHPGRPLTWNGRRRASRAERLRRQVGEEPPPPVSATCGSRRRGTPTPDRGGQPVSRTMPLAAITRTGIPGCGPAGVDEQLRQRVEHRARAGVVEHVADRQHDLLAGGGPQRGHQLRQRLWPHPAVGHHEPGRISMQVQLQSLRPRRCNGR